ncbi:hypothetical protein K488DRAFT_80463 [Vararia minispora EC-137]|uniref:Uncharacterized protein n=1 Tax=Vararia minispora EC-137 TaxID=1314806 RepID=A0ACB8QAM3_9AGAM|nr:hypothetical protein K488DRAFT_80463 [Vararia minispora EC-137]
MSSSPFPRRRAPSPFFRHRPLGRAPSPPTWACYEQIHALAYDSEPESDGSFSGSSEHSESDEEASARTNLGCRNDAAAVDTMEMDKDVRRSSHKGKGKGKATALDEKSGAREHIRKERRSHQPVVALRPILTIQRSQGFVWNQDLFVPPYIKDRYVASTSPPSSSGFISAPASSAHSIVADYEVEVVEIRVKDGELEELIP